MPIRVVAAAIIEGGRVLACRRPPHASRGGLWELPGGKVERGESDADALVRELEEELGIVARADGFLAEAEHAYPDVTIVLAAWACARIAGEITPREHDAIRWLADDELDEVDWAPADVPLLDAVRAALRG